MKLHCIVLSSLLFSCSYLVPGKNTSIDIEKKFSDIAEKAWKRLLKQISPSYTAIMQTEVPFLQFSMPILMQRSPAQREMWLRTTASVLDSLGEGLNQISLFQHYFLKDYYSNKNIKIDLPNNEIETQNTFHSILVKEILIPYAIIHYSLTDRTWDKNRMRLPSYLFLKMINNENAINAILNNEKIKFKKSQGIHFEKLIAAPLKNKLEHGTSLSRLLQKAHKKIELSEALYKQAKFNLEVQRLSEMLKQPNPKPLNISPTSTWSWSSGLE